MSRGSGPEQLEAVLAELIADGRAQPASGTPAWLRELGPAASDDIRILYQTLAPGPIGNSGARLLEQAEPLTTYGPDWRLAVKSDFLAVIADPHGGVVGYWTRHGDWTPIELTPVSIHPRDLTPIGGLAGWLRDELEGEGVQEVNLDAWRRATLIMFVIGTVGLILSAILMFVFADHAVEQRPR